MLPPVCKGLFLACVLAATSPNAGSELEQARPQTSGEEELQLQLALAMSREAAEQVEPHTVDIHHYLWAFCSLKLGFIAKVHCAWLNGRRAARPLLA